MFLHCISSKEIEKYINKLPSKDSLGYDNISNTLLKKLNMLFWSHWLIFLICPLQAENFLKVWNYLK